MAPEPRVHVCETSPKVEIVDLRRETGPLDLVRQLERVLALVPGHLLGGLDRIVLRNASAMTRRQRREMGRSDRRRTPMKDALGSYGRARPPRGAYIQLFVDNIYRDFPERVLWIPLGRIPVLRYEVLNSIFFHELAHHVQALELPQKRQSEKETDRLGAELYARSFRRRLPLLVPFVVMLRKIGRLALACRRRRGGSPLEVTRAGRSQGSGP